jgi:hypothetical protein
MQREVARSDRDVALTVGDGFVHKDLLRSFGATRLRA